VAQLQQLGVQSIDLFVGTHPHADHIGQVGRVFDARSTEFVGIVCSTTAHGREAVGFSFALGGVNPYRGPANRLRALVKLTRNL
jgi:glyoxylase-like metal-dependent hydrolase (beta-lactamase superfamily II)